MNNQAVPSSPEKKPAKKFYVNFNQDNTSLAIGNHNGFRLFVIDNVDEVKPVYTNDQDDAFIIERLFSSSLVAIVTLACPRKLKVCHFKKGTEICNYSYSNNILAVKLNRNRLLVILEESLYIHSIRDMKVIHTIRDTPPNPHGLCALSKSTDTCYIAYPGKSTDGEVQVFDASNLKALRVFKAHESPLAALEFTPDGTKVATASEKGTVIRITSAINGARLLEFRRGMKRCVDISCLSFSDCGKYLGCSSNTETVHVFKLTEVQNETTPAANEVGWMGYLSNYLPSQVTDVFNQGRAFAIAHMPFCGVKNVLGIKMIQGQLRLLVATEEGILYIYNLNTDETGDLALYKKHKLVDDEKPDADATTEEASSKSEPVSIEESDKLRAVLEATATPPKNSYQLSYEQEYPPLMQD